MPSKPLGVTGKVVPPNEFRLRGMLGTNATKLRELIQNANIEGLHVRPQYEAVVPNMIADLSHGILRAAALDRIARVGGDCLDRNIHAVEGDAATLIP